MTAVAPVRQHGGRPVPLYAPHEKFFLWTVFAASTVFTDRDKRLIELLLRLDKPTAKHPIGGSFAHAATLADYLGRGWCERTVRRRLKRLQRAETAVRTGRTKGTRWFVQVPADVLALCPPRGSDKGHDSARERARNLLDVAILASLAAR